MKKQVPHWTCVYEFSDWEAPAMPYTSNPFAPKARKKATNLVKRGVKIAEVARQYGVHRSTVGRWMKRATKHSLEFIETISSAPQHQSTALSQEIVNRIIQIRKEHNRCAVIVHAKMKAEGYSVSVSSVKRVIKRHRLTRKNLHEWHWPDSEGLLQRIQEH